MLGLFVVLGGAGVLAQDPAPEDAEFEAPPYVLLDPDFDNDLQVAASQLQAKQYAAAITTLQTLMQRPQSRFTTLVPAVGSRMIFVDGRIRARHLLETLPEAAQQTYRLKHDAEARRRFVRAREAYDPDALAAVVDRFPIASITPAAFDLLGDVAFDRGRFGLAAWAYGRRLALAAPKAPEALALLLARRALALALSGTEKRASLAVAALKQRCPDVAFALGGKRYTGRTFSLDAFALAGLRSGGSEAVSSDNAAVGPAGAGPDGSAAPPAVATLFGSPLWAAELSALPRGSGAQQVSPAEAMLTPLSAASVGGRLIVPEPEVIRGFELFSGTPLWSPIARMLRLTDTDARRLGLSLDQGNGNGRRWGWRMPRQPTTPSRPDARQSLAWSGAALDNRRIYALVDVALVEGRRRRALGTTTRVLAAFDAARGTPVWLSNQVELPSGTLGAVRFTTAPTLVDGTLYASFVSNGGVYVGAFTPQTGAARWATFLFQAYEPPAGVRGVRGVPALDAEAYDSAVVVSDDLVFVTTHYGLASAVERDTGRVAWVASYWQSPGRGRTRSSRTRKLLPSAPIYARGCLVFVSRLPGGHFLPGEGWGGAPVASQVLAFDAQTGKQLWSTSKGRVIERISYAAGVSGDYLYLIGPEILVLEITTGQLVARASVVGRPTGRALLRGKHCYVPTAEGLDDYVLSATNGAGRLTREHYPGAALAGNLGLHAGVGLALAPGHAGLRAYYRRESALMRLNAAIRRTPRDPAVYLRRAEFYRAQGQIAEALADLHTGAALLPPGGSPARSALLAAWIDLVERALEAGESLPAGEIAKLKAAAGTDPPLRLALLGVGLAASARQPAKMAAEIVALLGRYGDRLVSVPGRELSVATLVREKYAGWRARLGAELDAKLDDELTFELKQWGQDLLEGRQDRWLTFRRVTEGLPGAATPLIGFMTRAMTGEDYARALGLMPSSATLAQASAVTQASALALALRATRTAGLDHRARRDRLLARLAALPADTPLTLLGERLTAGKYLERFAAVRAVSRAHRPATALAARDTLSDFAATPALGSDERAVPLLGPAPTKGRVGEHRDLDFGRLVLRLSSRSLVVERLVPARVRLATIDIPGRFRVRAAVPASSTPTMPGVRPGWPVRPGTAVAAIAALVPRATLWARFVGDEQLLVVAGHGFRVFDLAQGRMNREVKSDALRGPVVVADSGAIMFQHDWSSRDTGSWGIQAVVPRPTGSGSSNLFNRRRIGLSRTAHPVAALDGDLVLIRTDTGFAVHAVQGTARRRQRGVGSGAKIVERTVGETFRVDAQDGRILLTTKTEVRAYAAPRSAFDTALVPLWKWRAPASIARAGFARLGPLYGVQIGDRVQLLDPRDGRPLASLSVPRGTELIDLVRAGGRAGDHAAALFIPPRSASDLSRRRAFAATIAGVTLSGGAAWRLTLADSDKAAPGLRSVHQVGIEPAGGGRLLVHAAVSAGYQVRLVRAAIDLAQGAWIAKARATTRLAGGPDRVLPDARIVTTRRGAHLPLTAGALGGGVWKVTPGPKLPAPADPPSKKPGPKKPPADGDDFS